MDFGDFIKAMGMTGGITFFLFLLVAGIAKCANEDYYTNLHLKEHKKIEHKNPCNKYEKDRKK